MRTETAAFAIQQGASCQAGCEFDLCPQYCSDVIDQVFGLANGFTQFGCVEIGRRLNLKVTDQHAQRVIDHHSVVADLQADQKNQERIAKHHGADGKPRAFFVAPQVAPGESFYLHALARTAKLANGENVVINFNVKLNAVDGQLGPLVGFVLVLYTHTSPHRTTVYDFML